MSLEAKDSDCDDVMVRSTASQVAGDIDVTVEFGMTEVDDVTVRSASSHGIVGADVTAESVCDIDGLGADVVLDS